jgi:hypothetical protein
MGEEDMKHFTAEEWIDFVNQVAPAERMHVMQQHLSGGCERCAASVALWQKVRGSAAMEANFVPPAAQLRMAKAAFAMHKMRKPSRAPKGTIELLFDSFLQPLVEGARSAATGARQMLYKADPYQIDLHIESMSNGNRVKVTGQVLDVSSPEMIGRDMSITISNRRGNIVRTATNEFGEFHGEVENTGDLEVILPAPGGRPITLSLRDALGDFPGGSHRHV